MGLALISPLPETGMAPFMAVITTFSEGSAPPRPHPQPPGGNWSPIHPEHPIANPWPPYVDIGPPMPQPPIDPPDPGEPPIINAKPPHAGQLPQSEPGGWMYLYSPQYNQWLWAWTGTSSQPPAKPK